MNITPILNALILLISALVSAFLIPWIKSVTTEKQRDDLVAWVRILVAAAEQLYDQADQKRSYVLGWLTDHGYHIDDSIANLIESEVLRLHLELYGRWERDNDGN